MFDITNSTSAFYDRSRGSMQALRAQVETAQLQVATGERLVRSSDDPVASAQLRALARAERLAQVDGTNAARAGEELRSADAALEDVTLALIRARELAVQAGSDTTSPEGRTAIADELASLRDAIFANANATSLGGRSLFGGDVAGPAYAINAAGDVGYIGDSLISSLDIAVGVSIERGLTGPSVFDFEDAGTSTDVFVFLRNLETSLRAGAEPAQSARDAVAGLDAAIGSVTQNQTILGTRLGWLETVERMETTRSLQRTQESTDLGGVDIADAITRMQQALTVLEASQTSFARIASLSLFNRI